MFNNPQIRRIALWWVAVNSIGVVISIFIERYTFYQGIKTGSYKLPPDSNEALHITWWLALTLALGALQVLACCWLIPLIKVRSNIFRMVAGSLLGILTALFFTLLPVFAVNSVLWLEPLIGIYAFLLSGIVFGAIVGRVAHPIKP